VYVGAWTCLAARPAELLLLPAFQAHVHLMLLMLLLMLLHTLLSCCA
jgi:hypothetical protein